LLVSVAERPAAVPLEGTRWGLEVLNGRPAPAGAGGKPVDLTLDPDEGRAAGFSGCNRFTGGYTLEQRPDGSPGLSFGPAAGTMMACPEGMELEREFLQTLPKTTGYRLRGGRLTLLADGAELATFAPL
jgi:putative lipoprotein